MISTFKFNLCVTICIYPNSKLETKVYFESFVNNHDSCHDVIKYLLISSIL